MLTHYSFNGEEATIVFHYNTDHCLRDMRVISDSRTSAEIPANKMARSTLAASAGGAEALSSSSAPSAQSTADDDEVVADDDEVVDLC